MRSELEAQLSALETSPRTAKGGDLFAPPPKNWRPEPRYVTQEPDYAAGFQVGDKFMHDPRPGSPFQGRRQAIPHPKYDAPPGTIITKELDEAYWREWQLWNRGSMELEVAIRHRLQIAKFPDDGCERRPTKEELEIMFAGSWGWLKGLWSSRGYSEPSMEQLDEWSRGRQKSTSLSEQPASTQDAPR